MHPAFHDRERYRPSGRYELLPFRFLKFEGDAYLLTNQVGEYVVLPRSDLSALVDRSLSPESASYKALKSRHFLYDPESPVAIDLLALKVRTRAEHLARSTGLHIFVVTLRCDHSCHYCQVSRQTENRTSFDMSIEHAERAIELAFRSPSPALKIEFQGGEPLLNFELIRHIVESCKARNVDSRRSIQFVIASNLSRLTDEMLAFCKSNEIFLSTSIDGPEELHERQRPLRGGHSHRTTVASIERARATLGKNAVSALMTTTEATLERVDEVIDEYVRLDFHSIFLRSLSPYGFAVKTSLMRRYTAVDWVRFYQRGLDRILSINQRGYPLREEYTTILLQKMFSPQGASYVDLQSPSGMGIGALVYNYDGAIYASDEGRMLAEMGDESFRLGHLTTDSYESVMTSEQLLGTLLDTMTEGAPMCSDCAYLPYCGADPAFHRATQGDAVGHKAFSAFCSKQLAVLRHLIGLLESDGPARETLMSWV